VSKRLFLHYTEYQLKGDPGGQVRDSSGQRPTGLLDTIVPYDFESRGQIDSDILHQHLVSNLPPNSTLFVILDCCHSGSALELPFIYRSDDDGNVNMVDNVKQVRALPFIRTFTLDLAQRGRSLILNIVL